LLTRQQADCRVYVVGFFQCRRLILPAQPGSSLMNFIKRDGFMPKWKHSQPYLFVSGQIDDSVFYAAPGQLFSISRGYKYPTLTANNHIKGAEMKNLRDVYNAADPLYRDDLKTYASRYRSEHLQDPNMYIPFNNGFAAWIMMCYAWKKSDPTHVDLATLVIQDIVALNADIQKINDAVEAGFLPNIAIHDDLSSSIV
jgi:hypothetical protein